MAHLIDISGRSLSQRLCGGVKHVVHLRAEHQPDGFKQQASPSKPGMLKQRFAAVLMKQVNLLQLLQRQ